MWKLKEYKFKDEGSILAFRKEYRQNEAYVELIIDNGGTFIVSHVNSGGCVTHIQVKDSECDVYLNDDDLTYFEPAGKSISFKLEIDLPLPRTKEEAIKHVNRIKAIFDLE
ncbi:MAG: hypothetical protein [Caudoviricetes sp.]|nr:MAG: hypothetical protein [Caudoviricetes sp.]